MVDTAVPQRQISKMAITADTPVQFLKGVGPHISECLTRKNVRTAWDLLHYFPIRYLDRRKIHSIARLPLEKKQTFVAEINSYAVKNIARGRRRILEMMVSDQSGYAKMTFFHFNEGWLKKKYPVGTKAIFLGDVKRWGALKSMIHPEMEAWDEDEGIENAVLPFYSLTEGLHQKTIRRIITQNLDELTQLVVEDARSVREDGTVKFSLGQAYHDLHLPPRDANLEDFNLRKSVQHQRVIYDEFFYLQLGVVSKKYKNTTQMALALNPPRKLFNQALSSLPFELTAAQRQALDDIAEDFKSGKSMNRLLQGDVGSGKTMVAFLSSLLAIESSTQAALMVPTEILAEQHFKNLLKFENTLGVRIECLTSSTPEGKRADILSRLRHGQVDLLIGTHALIVSDVHFYHLAYVIIDEQHRFGVEQRAQLKAKGKLSQKGEPITPHMLFMTATPIPRTLSMCLYGDMDVSLIREMPRGRLPIMTKVFHERGRSRAYELVRKELKKGRQAYFVYPLVEESEKLEHLKDATLMHASLTEEFSEFGVALVHGRMKAQEKEAIMQSFKSGEKQILVSTTVIEVGVDVPNATMMVIEHAERFGLSQLHQLRGRVGRSSHQSYCILMAGYAQSEESRFRLKVMEDSTDGFVIAEEDLKLRGPGEFLGTRQAGLPDFQLAELLRDGHLLNAAKKRAEEIVQADPELAAPKNELIKKIMFDRWGRKLDLTLI